jgi:PAS domain S-box-containing protein
MATPPDNRYQSQQHAPSSAHPSASDEPNDVLVHLVDLARQSVDGPLTMLAVLSRNGEWEWIGGDHLKVSDICRERLVAAICGEDVPPAREPDEPSAPYVVSDILTVGPGRPRLRWVAARIANHGALISCNEEPWEPDERLAAILSGFAIYIEQELTRQNFRNASTANSRNNQFADLIVNSARDGVVGLDLDGKCRFVNETAAELLACSADDLIDQPVTRFFSRSGNRIESEIVRFKQGKRVDIDDATLLCRDGSHLPVELTVLPNIEENGQVIGAVLRFSDLSERKTALAAAELSEARHQAFLRMTLDSIITIDDAGKVIEFNQAAEQTFRCSASDVLGTEMAETLFPQPWRDWYRAAFKTFAETGTGPLSGRRIHITALRWNGRTFPAEITITRLPAKDGWIFTLYVHDLSERKWNERRRVTRYTVTRILAESESPTEALPKILEALCQGLEWDWAALWTREPGTTEMQLDLTWNRGAIEAGPLEIASREMSFEPGYGFIGEIWSKRQASWIQELSDSTEYVRSEAALACGLHSVAAMPIIGRDDVIGVIEVYSQRVRERDAEMLRHMDSLGSQIGQFIERKQVEEERIQILAREQAARAEAQAAERRLAFLAEASAQLSSTLDYEVTLANVARLAVPKLADYCAIELVDDDGRIRTLEVADIDPAKEAMDRQIHAKRSTNLNSDHPVAQVFRTGRPLLFPDVDDSVLRLISGDDDEYFHLLRELGNDSCMYVPMTARGRTIGVISFVSAESGHRYGPSDLALAQELTRRAALAIDNARLYREAQDAIRAREEFLSIASHELKTPLTTVKGYSQIIARLLRRSSLDRDRLIYLASQLQNQLGRFETLIADLLDISRIQRGGLELRPERTDLVALTENVLSRFTYPAEPSNPHQFHLDAPDSYIGVWDPDRLDQVLTNLLSNAVKYSPEGGEINIRIQPQEDDLVQISVSDPGIGIPEEEQGRLFRPFARSESVQRAISGVGLGLYISQQIVDRHGGSIVLDSQPERGSTFTVTLPRVFAGSENGPTTQPTHDR